MNGFWKKHAGSVMLAVALAGFFVPLGVACWALPSAAKAVLSAGRGWVLFGAILAAISAEVFVLLVAWRYRWETMARVALALATFILIFALSGLFMLFPVLAAGLS